MATAPLDYRGAKEKLAGVLGQPLTTPVADLMTMAAEQLDSLCLVQKAMGFQDAINTLREAGDPKNVLGVVYSTSADFLDKHTKWHNKAEVCKCRCNEGRNCGGCGHEGCGYTA